MMSKNELTLRVLSPDGQVFEAGDLREVVVPLVDGGSIGIRPKHAPLIAETVDGPVKFHSEDEVGEVHLLAGILSVRDHVITILTSGIAEDENPESEDLTDPFSELAKVLQVEQKTEGGVE